MTPYPRNIKHPPLQSRFAFTTLTTSLRLPHILISRQEFLPKIVHMHDALPIKSSVRGVTPPRVKSIPRHILAYILAHILAHSRSLWLGEKTLRTLSPFLGVQHLPSINSSASTLTCPTTFLSFCLPPQLPTNCTRLQRWRRPRIRLRRRSAAARTLRRVASRPAR